MYNRIQGQSIEKSIHDKDAKIFLGFILPFLCISIFVICIIAGIHEIEQLNYADSIWAFAVAVMMAFSTIGVFLKAHHYKIFSSKIIMKKSGLEYYENNRLKYSFSWEDISKVEYAAFGAQYSMYYIFFYTKISRERMEYCYKKRRINKDMLYTYLDYRDIGFIKDNYKGEIKMDNILEKRYKAYQKRKANSERKNR